MKKLIPFALISIALLADEIPPPPPPVVIPEEKIGPLLTELKFGYFRFGDRTMRHIYDRETFDVELVATFRLYDPLFLYTAAGCVPKHGRFHHNRKKTFVIIVPVSVGAQFDWKIVYDLNYYITLGPRYFFVHQSIDRGPTANRSGYGGFVNTGFQYYLDERVIFDFFGEYSYGRAHLYKHHSDVGGLTIGGGIGYYW